MPDIGFAQPRALSELDFTPEAFKLPDWAEYLWLPSRYKAMHGGRGSAKSHSVARALVLRGWQKTERILCAREYQNSMKDSVKQLLEDVINEYGLGVLGNGFYMVTDKEIRGANGTLFVFAGLRTNMNSIKSMEGITICWVEEANTISKDSLEKLTPTIRTEKSEIWFVWNPEKDSDPVDKMFRGEGSPPPNSIVLEVNYEKNPWFPAELREEMEHHRKTDPDKWAHIWGGGYKRNSEARVFKNYRIGTDEELDAAKALATRFYQGADWGFSIDPTVLVRFFIIGKNLYIDEEAYRIGCSIDHIPALFAGDWKKEYGPKEWDNPYGWNGLKDAIKWPITADSARPETIDYMKRRGFKIKPSIKGAGSVQEGVEFLQTFNIIVRPSCVHTADELAFYSYKVDKLTKEVLPILEDKKNHVIDSLRYGAEGVRRGTYTLDNV